MTEETPTYCWFTSIDIVLPPFKKTPFIVDFPIFRYFCMDFSGSSYIYCGIVLYSYIFPMDFSTFSQAPGVSGPGRHRSEALLDVEEFLSHLDSMLSHQQWIQMQSPALPQLVLHDPRRISKRGRMGPPDISQKKGLKLGESGGK